MKAAPKQDSSAEPTHDSDFLTATERVDGKEHLIVLEEDDEGRYVETFVVSFEGTSDVPAAAFN